MHWLLALFVFFCGGVCFAQDKPVSMILADTESGYLFMRENEKQMMPPASLAKLMTLYLSFSALEKGWLKWDDKLTASPYASGQPASNLNLYPGQTISVRQAISALIVKSANDVSVVLAEALGGDEETFVKMMNETAQQLNMAHTHFANASGLHDVEQQTTAQDMAVLALAILKHYPQYYPLFAQTSFDFDGHTYVSHNHVLQEYEGAEGMKTGYVAAVGYNLITTAKKNDNRLLGVVMGYDSVLGRDEAMKAILDEGFKRVAVQKKAVASGKLSPAMDPLHRRLMLPKLDMAKLVPQMPYHIKAALTMKKVPVYMATGEEKGGPFWTIQVGAFSSIEKAQRMASRALAFLHGQDVKIKTSPAKSLYRAQLTGFSNRQGAVQACRQLNEKECPCFLVHDRV